jgi:hypothetical protein
MSPTSTTLAPEQIEVAAPWLSLLIACLALLFTVGSFWWLNARQGRLKSFEPHTFAAARAHILRLRFPLVLYNSGPKPIVIQDLRLSFPDEPQWNIPLPWTSTRSRLRPESDDQLALPAVFSLLGRTAQQMFIEFGGDFPEVTPLGRDYQVQVEVKVGHRQKWQRLIAFPLRGAHITSPQQYLAYSNRAHDLTEETISQSKAALEQLVSQRAQQQSAPTVTD